LGQIDSIKKASNSLKISKLDALEWAQQAIYKPTNTLTIRYLQAKI